MNRPSTPVVLPLSVHTWSRWANAFTCWRSLGTGANAGSATWPSANRAIYVPFTIPFDYPIHSVFWGNGTSATGNADFGIYTLDGARLYSTGSTARSGTSSLQTVTATPFVLPAGSYYMALAFSTGAANTGWLNVSVTTATGRMIGLLQEDSALPLPSAATFAAWASTGYPLCGFSRVI